MNDVIALTACNFTEFGSFRGGLRKMVEDTPVLLQQKCRPQNLVFSDISFMVILAGVTPSESDKVGHFALSVAKI